MSLESFLLIYSILGILVAVYINIHQWYLGYDTKLLELICTPVLVALWPIIAVMYLHEHGHSDFVVIKGRKKDKP